MNRKQTYTIVKNIDRRIETAFQLANEAEDRYWETDDPNQWQRNVHFCRVAYGLQKVASDMLLKCDD